MMDAKQSAASLDAGESADYKHKYKILKRKLKGLVYVSVGYDHNPLVVCYWLRIISLQSELAL